MQAQKDSKFSPTELVESVLKSRHPATVEELARLVMAESTIGEEDLLTIFKGMATDGSLILEKPVYEIASTWDYLLTPSLSMWLMTTLSITSLAMTAVLTVPDSFPIVIVRWLSGSILALFLPGYAMLQLLFPRQSEMDSLERFVFSIGLSLALVPLIGFVLNYTPWGIQFIPITTSISAFTIAFLIGAARRKYTYIREHGKWS